MTTPLAGISEEDWAATPLGVRVGFLEVLRQLHRQQQENEQLRAQLTALATELATLRERISRTSRNSSKPPSSDSKGFKPPEEAVAASGAASRAIQDLGRSCCRLSALTRWWSITRTPAAAAAPFWRVTIPTHCGIR